MNRTNEEEMKDKRIVVNSVVQVNENGQEKWIGCFVQVGIKARKFQLTTKL